jgi:hypothetical protein
MGKKLSVGILAAALLLSGLLVGVSYGDAPSKAIADPQVLRLVLSDQSEGKGTHPINDARIAAEDQDGNLVGWMRWQGKKGVDWHVTIVFGLQPGTYTERGTVQTAGIFRGFSGESLAVTGGTGAYSNVRGYLKLTAEPGDVFVTTLYLTP